MAAVDPISDMFAAMANASRASLDVARVGASRYKEAILRVLQQEGFIRGFRVTREKTGRRVLEIQMAYGSRRERLLNGVTRVSRPGRRRYVSLEELKPLLRRLETAVLSTSHGILTGRQAVERKTGGELLALVW
jgi:small subunit ribosomal protein S8